MKIIIKIILQNEKEIENFFLKLLKKKYIYSYSMVKYVYFLYVYKNKVCKDYALNIVLNIDKKYKKYILKILTVKQFKFIVI